MPTLIAEAIIVQDNKVLLVQQRKPVAFGLWCFPGGHVEAGETLEEAAKREVAEEVGAKLINAKLFRTSTIEAEGQREVEIHTFTGELQGELKLKDDELLAYGWFSLDSLEAVPKILRAPIVLELAREALQK